MKPINLAKCKIGQRVRLRNGEIRHIEYIGSKNMAYPYRLNTLSCHMASGRYYGASQQSGLDIIAILPLPKKKAKAKRMGKPVDISQNRRSIKATIQNLKNAIQHLKGLL